MKRTGIHFFNEHNGENRGLISHITEDHELLIQLIRYTDTISVISICLSIEQAEELEKIIKKFKHPF